MRVLLAAAPHADTFGYAMPPPGLLRLGGELLRRGVEVRAEDLPHRLATGELPGDDRLADAAAERLLIGPPFDVLGLSVMGATTPIALAIAARVRRARPGARIVLGGPGTTGIDAALLERFADLDAVVRGEGEETLPALLERWSAGRDAAGTAGVTWREPSGAVRREPDRPPLADLAALPAPAWELFPPFADYARLTAEGDGLVPVDSGRGCAFDCSFCTIGRFWSRRSRVLPVERLLDEVLAAAALPGARQVYLCHDLFGAPREHALAFCRGLLERGVELAWECRARLDHLDDELLELMARAGCYRVLLGVETADPDLRNAHQKGMRTDLDPLAVVSACARHGVTPILSFLLGLPGEDEAALRATLDLARDAALSTAVHVSLHLPNPQPGCDLGETHGAASRPVAGIPPDMAFGAGETAAERELIAAHPDLFSTWSLLTALPGGEPRLRRLARLAAELPPLLEERPRTFALLARSRGLDTLGLFDAWCAERTSADFDAFAAGSGLPLVTDALAWERALADGGGRAPRLLTAATDPIAAVRWLSEHPAGAPPAGAATHLAVLHGPRGARTLRLSPHAALLVRLSREDPRRFRRLAAEHTTDLAPLTAGGLLPETR